ncbi:hypothetical protein B0H10DRAFT_1958057 [Mycena sp. CBHHK59/15]|nr:hypothetical protein B0H10DRAFT_1958057 [Mycena sp. CBHHK59/15]
MPSAPAPHTIRNPGKRVQRSRRRVALSGAAKASKTLQAAESRRRREAFDDAIDAFFAYRQSEISRIAKEHGKSEKVVEGILCNKTQYKSTRAPSLRNAIIHDRALKAQAEGNSKALRELQLDLQDDVDDGAAEVLAKNMDEAEKKRLINQLIEYREMKRRGVHATTAAAITDGRQTASRIGDALIDLFERTGIRGIALFTRGNADDPTLPHCVDSDDAMEFFGQNLGIPAVDVLRRFESWSCTLDQGTKNKNDVNSIGKQVSKLVQDGLRKIKNNNNLLMEYVNYDIVIREGKGVELAGWPADVPMTRPATMNVETARRIRDQLRTGEIHWVAMTKTQHNELIAEHNAQREAMGAGALRKRALRSDIGTKRGPQKGKKGAKKTAEKMTKESARDEEWVDDDRAMVTTPTPPLTTGRERPALDAVAAGSVLLSVFRQPTAVIFEASALNGGGAA